MTNILERVFKDLAGKPMSHSQYVASRPKEAQIESAKTQAGLAADFTPILGEGKSFYEGVQDLSKTIRPPQCPTAKPTSLAACHKSPEPTSSSSCPSSRECQLP